MHRGFDKFALGLMAAGVLAYASVQPKFELHPEMPAGFMEQVPASQHAAETRIANAYWACVVNQIQWSYHYGDRLPAAPPAEFSVAGQGLGPKAESAATRTRYWAKIQTVWYEPNIWTKHYSVALSWARDPAQFVHQWVYEGTPAER